MLVSFLFYLYHLINLSKNLLKILISITIIAIKVLTIAPTLIMKPKIILSVRDLVVV